MRPFETGFSLVELVVVIVVAGILAVVAIPKFSSTGFESRGYFDQTVELVRYAQKLAIAQRQLIFVEFAGVDNTFKVCYTTNSATCNCSSAVVLPTGSRPGKPSGVTLAATTDAFCFDTIGRPVQTSTLAAAPLNTITVTGDATRTAVIESETGYLH